MCGENGSIRDLDHVVWEVPLGILAQLVHVKLRATGAWTVEPVPPLAPIAAQSLAAAVSTRQQMQW